MGDRKQFDGQDRLSETELWGSVYRRLLVWAIRSHGLNPADAEEVVQEAIRQFLTAGGATVDGAGSLLRGVGSRINGLIANRRRKKAFILTSDGATPEPENGDEGRVEERLINDDWSRKATSLLLDRIDKDKILFSMIEKMADGLETPSELADALRLDAQDIYNARRRLNTHVAAVTAAMEDS